MKTFYGLDYSRKFGICGLPIRLDTYKNCSFKCIYCFAMNKISSSNPVRFDSDFEVADVKHIERILILSKENPGSSFLLNLINSGITWHCGGMSDPFQPLEKLYNSTKNVVDLTNKYDISILFSTKGSNLFNVNVNPELHTFQLSFSNNQDNKKLEPNVDSFEKRYSFYKELKKEGFKVGIRLQPFIIGITNSEIVDLFNDADHFTIEGLKLNRGSLADEILSIIRDDKKSFKYKAMTFYYDEQKRMDAYEPFLSKLKKYNIPFSLGDNDMRYLTTSKCCCGDSLIKKSSDFNVTAMINKYGISYSCNDLLNELGNFSDCVVQFSYVMKNQLIHGYERNVRNLLSYKYKDKTNPISPKFQWFEPTTHDLNNFF